LELILASTESVGFLAEQPKDFRQKPMHVREFQRFVEPANAT
jgi:hypothetical protein